MEEKRGFIADLHIHSRYSRACSKDITIENLEKYAIIKGIDLLGTGDFTHPLWLNEIKEKLQDNGKGIFCSKSGFKFILTGEISLMYSQGKGRRIHFILLAPNLETIDKINSFLDSKGRRDYDGRPIFGFNSRELVVEMEKISSDIEIIPAHIWTPYFGIFGSKSGFDSLKEAFGDKENSIHAIETGMSSSPEMNWKISELNSRTIVSFSDSHSFWPWRLGREATIFEKTDSYKEIIGSIRNNSILGTIETDPAYGIYHYSGHKDCNFSCSPEECRKINYICPVCKNKLTIGVEDRVEELKNQPINANPSRKMYWKILPLHEIIALSKSSTISSKKTWEVYNKLVENLKNEFNILLFANRNDLERALPNNPLLVDLIMQNREGKIKVKAGYDGKYGEALLPEIQSKLF